MVGGIGECYAKSSRMGYKKYVLTFSRNVSISLPMTGQPIVVGSTEIKLDSVKQHCGPQISPAPDVAADIATLVFPPVAVAAVAAHRSEMLHQKARVNRNEDARTEPADQTKSLAHSISILKCRFL